MDDFTCLHALLTSASPVARDLSRRLYETAAVQTGTLRGERAGQRGPVPGRDPHREVPGVRRQIAECAGISPHEVLVDIPPVPGEFSLGVRVKNRHTVVSFEEFSPRIRTFNATRREQWRLGVYTLPEYRERVAEAGCEVLHIRKPTRQDTLF